ncbi:hypothetical protein COCCADRAFT_110182, partial [Bipolaris zeicola 26-R-13]
PSSRTAHSLLPLPIFIFSCTNKPHLASWMIQCLHTDQRATYLLTARFISRALSDIHRRAFRILECVLSGCNGHALL